MRSAAPVRGRAIAVELSTASVLTLALLLVSVLTREAVGLSAPFGIAVGALALAGGLVLALRASPGERLQGLLGVNLETDRGWRRRRFLIVLVPGGLAFAAMAVALHLVGDRAWGAFRALQVAMLPSPAGYQRFADLAQFTDAATCSRPVVVGTVVCDRLDRPLNQNPLFVTLLDPISRHVGLLTFGAVLAAVTILLLAFLASRSPWGHLVALPLLFSPATALAVERGNAELVILLLTASGLLLLARRDAAGWVIGAALLTLAAMLKVYPVFFLLPFMVLRPVKRALLAVVGGVGVGVYWLLQLHTLTGMLAVTQRGTALSYGLNAIFSPRAPGWLLALVLALVVAAGLVLARRWSSSSRPWGVESDLALAFSSFYVLSFFAGANWSYRLVFVALLIPAASRPTVLRGQLVIALLVVWLSPTVASAAPQLGLAVLAAAALISGLPRRRWLGRRGPGAARPDTGSPLPQRLQAGPRSDP